MATEQLELSPVQVLTALRAQERVAQAREVARPHLQALDQAEQQAQVALASILRAHGLEPDGRNWILDQDGDAVLLRPAKPMPDVELLREDIRVLGLPEPMNRVLGRAGFETVSQLSQTRRSELLGVRGIGRHTVMLVSEKLAEKGLGFHPEEGNGRA